MRAAVAFLTLVTFVAVAVSLIGVMGGVPSPRSPAPEGTPGG